jgi:hypothetical protein
MPKVEVGQFRPDGNWQEETQAAVFALTVAVGAGQEEGT